MATHCLRQAPNLSERRRGFGLCLGALAMLTVNFSCLGAGCKQTDKAAEEKPEVRAEPEGHSVIASLSNGPLDGHQANEPVSSKLLPPVNADARHKLQGSEHSRVAVGSNSIVLSDERHSILENGRVTHSDHYQQNSSTITYNYRAPRDITSAPLCGSGWQLEGLSCYKLTTEKTWQSARHACRSWNGVLAEIHNFEQQRELQDFLGSQVPSIWAAWIGLSDRKTEGQWMWDSGKKATFFYWFSNEPNSLDGEEDCVNVWPSTNSRWNDYACNVTFPGVCQKGCTDSSKVCELLSQRGLCANALFKHYMHQACRRSCRRCL